MSSESVFQAGAPGIDEIKSDDLRKKVSRFKQELQNFSEGSGVRDHKQFRQELLEELESAKNGQDRAAIATIAFLLAFSYDHFKPYRFDQAIQELEMVLEYYPDWLSARFNLAVALVHNKQYGMAVVEFDSVEGELLDVLVSCINERDVSLVMGKLLLFRAEARSKLGDSNELSIAKTEIIRAESYLLFSGLSESRAWLMQINDRLSSFNVDVNNPRLSIVLNDFSGDFFKGSLLGFMTLIFLYFVVVGFNCQVLFVVFRYICDPLIILVLAVCFFVVVSVLFKRDE